MGSNIEKDKNTIHNEIKDEILHNWQKNEKNWISIRNEQLSDKELNILRLTCLKLENSVLLNNDDLASKIEFKCTNLKDLVLLFKQNLNKLNKYKNINVKICNIILYRFAYLIILRIFDPILIDLKNLHLHIVNEEINNKT